MLEADLAKRHRIVYPATFVTNATERARNAGHVEMAAVIHILFFSLPRQEHISRIYSADLYIGPGGASFQGGRASNEIHRVPVVSVPEWLLAYLRQFVGEEMQISPRCTSRHLIDCLNNRVCDCPSSSPFGAQHPEPLEHDLGVT